MTNNVNLRNSFHLTSKEIQLRLNWIDVMRGIAITLVVLGHSIGNTTDPLNKFILSFHMPVFFFISGLLTRCRQEDGQIISLQSYLLKKARGILLPQVFLFILHMAFDILVNHEKISASLVMTNLFYWFLIVLFYVSMLFWFVEKIGLVRKKVYLFGFIFILIAVFQIIKIQSSIKIEIVPMAMLFYVCGHYFMEYLKSNNTQKKLCRIQPCWVMTIPIIVICSYWNDPVLMYKNSYGNILFFFITSFCGIWVCYELAVSLSDNNIFLWLGKNTIIIYVFHIYIIKSLYGVGKIIIPFSVDYSYTFPAYLICFSITMIILVPIIFFCNRYLYWFFGRERRIH